MARRLAWADSHIDVALTTASQITPVNLLATLQLLDTVTVIRLIIRMFMVPQNLSDNVDGGTLIDMAIGVSASEAFQANVLSDPSAPADTPARGWLWKDRLIAVGNSVTGPPAHDVYFGTDLHADIRSMRKVDRGVLYFTAEAAPQAVSGVFLPVALTGIVRALCAT